MVSDIRGDLRGDRGDLGGESGCTESCDEDDDDADIDADGDSDSCNIGGAGAASCGGGTLSDGGAGPRIRARSSGVRAARTVHNNDNTITYE